MAITGTLKADFSSFYDAVTKAEKYITDLSGSADKAGDRLNRMTDNFSGKKVVQDATLMAEAIERAGGTSKLTANELQQVAAKAAEAAAKLKALGQDVPPGIQKLADAVKKVNVETTSLSDKLKTIGPAATSAGAALSASLTAPLLAIGGASLKASIDFESAFAGVKKTVSGTPAEMAALNEQFREMARTTPVSAVGIAQIGEQAGQLGVQKEKIAAFTKTIVDISVATNLTTEEAGSAFARLANVMKLPQEQFSNLGSAVVALGNFGASTEQEMLNMGQRIAAAGATAGFSTAQILGIANALSSVGIEAEAGGTAISRVITKMAVDVASGGGKLQTFAKVAGQTAQEFSTAWRKDAGAAFTQFMQGLADARKRGGDELLSLIHELGFDVNVRLANAFLSAANAGDLMRESIELGSRAFKENTELTRASGERYNTTANQLKVFWNNITDVGIALGDALTPALAAGVRAMTPMVKEAQELAKEFKALPTSMQVAAVGFAGLVASIGPLALALGGAAFAFNQFSAIVVAFPAIGAAATAAAAALTTGFAGMVAIAAGVSALVAAVGALSYGLTRLADVATGGKLSGWLTPFIAGTAELKLKTQEVAAVQDSMNLAFQRTGIHAKSAAEALELNTVWLKKHNEELNGVQAPAAAAAAHFQTLAEKVAELTAEQKQKIATDIQLGYGIKTIAKEEQIAIEVVSAYLKQQKILTAGQKEYAQALKEYNSVGANHKATVEAMSGAVVEAIKYDLARGQQQSVLTKIYSVTTEQIKAIIAVEKDEAAQMKDSLRLLGQVVVARNAMAAIKPDSKGLFGLGINDLDVVSKKIGKGFVNLAPDLSVRNAFQQIVRQAQTTGAAVEATLKKSMAQVPNILVQAFTGGGGLSGAVKALGVQIGADLFSEKGALASVTNSASAGLSKVFGSTIGGALGAALPGIGALVGPAIQGISALFGKIFGNPEKQINPLREAFVQAAGGLDALNVHAHAAGVTLDALLNAKNAEQYKKAVDDLTAAFGAYQQKIDGLKGEIADLQKSTVVDFGKMADIAKKYGVGLEGLGPKFQAAQIGASAQGIIDDFDTLNRGLGDVDEALTVMRKPINDIVNDSLKFKTAIPENFRPWVEQLSKTHQLIDENGKEIEDLTDIKFGAPVATEFQKVTDKIVELTLKLDDLIKALGNIKPVQIDVGYNYQPFNPPDVGGAFNGQVEPIRAAGGFEGRVTQPTLFLAGEAGPENVSIGQGGGGGGGTPAWARELIELMRNQPRMIRDAVQLAG